MLLIRTSSIPLTNLKLGTNDRFLEDVRISKKKYRSWDGKPIYNFCTCLEQHLNLYILVIKRNIDKRKITLNNFSTFF